MNARIAFTSIFLAAGFAGNALADAEYHRAEPFTGTKTRAEVRAELDAFRAAGVNPWADHYDQTRVFAGTHGTAAIAVAAGSQEQALAVMGSGPADPVHPRLPNGSANVAAGAQIHEAP